MSSSKPQRSVYPVKSIADCEGYPFHGEGKPVIESIKPVKERKIVVGRAYSQDKFDHKLSKGFVSTEDFLAQELLVYPRIDVVVGPLFCLFN